MLKSIKAKIMSGDTIIEVAFAIAIFSLVAIISINVMNAGLSTAQASMEVTSARNEIDGQAEALRYIHNSFTIERELPVSSQEYRDLWYTLTRSTNAANAGMMNTPDVLPSLSVDSCSEIYDGGDKSIFNDRVTAFALNTRVIDPNDSTFMPTATREQKINQIIVSTKNSANRDRFTETPLAPRLLYTDQYSDGETTNSETNLYEENEYRYLYRIEGLWVIAVRDATVQTGATPEFYDFHIRTCWNSPGSNRPSTIGTIIRLYNPELVEEIK